MATYSSLTDKYAQQRYSSLSDSDQEPGQHLVTQEYSSIKDQSIEEQQSLLKGVEINKQRESILNTPHPYKLKLLIGDNFENERKRIEALPLEQQVFEFQRLSEAAKGAQQRIKNIFAPTQTFLDTALPSKAVLVITGKKRLLSEEDISTVNPWIIAGAELAGSVYNIALISQIAGAIGITGAGGISGSIWKTLPNAVKMSKLGSYGARILAEAPEAIGIFGTLGFLGEALDQIAERKFSPIDITKKTAEAGLFGLVATPALQAPTTPLRMLGNAFVMGGWIAAEKLIRDGEITKEDYPEIIANSALGAAFSLIHTKSTTRRFEADRMAAADTFMLEAKLPGTPQEQAKTADLMGKVHGFSIADPKNPIFKSLDNKLQAHYLVKKEETYIRTPEGEIKIISPETGRILKGQQYQRGFKEAVEEKERILIRPEYLTTKDGTRIEFSGATRESLSNLLTAEEKILLEQINQTPGFPLTPQIPTEPAYVARAPQEVIKNFEAAESIITKLDSINQKADISIQSKTKRTTKPTPKITYPQSVIRSREEVDNSILSNIETGGAINAENLKITLGITEADEISQEISQGLVSEELGFIEGGFQFRKTSAQLGERESKEKIDTQLLKELFNFGIERNPKTGQIMPAEQIKESILSNLATKFIPAIKEIVSNIKKGRAISNIAYPLTDEDRSFLKEVINKFYQTDFSFNSFVQSLTGKKAVKPRDLGLITKQANNKAKEFNFTDAKAMYEAFRSEIPEAPQRFSIGITTATEQIPEIKELLTKAIKLDKEGKYKEAQVIYNEILDKGQGVLESLFTDLPEIKIEVLKTKGNFGEPKPTFSATAEVPPHLLEEFITRITALGKEWKQSNIHISRELINLPKGAILGKEVQNGQFGGIINEPNIDIEFTRKLTEKENFEISDKIINEIGLAGSTISPDRVKITFYNISKFEDHDVFIKKITKLYELLQSKGLFSSSKQSIRELRNYGNPENGATRTYEQILGEVPIAKETGKEVETITKQAEVKPTTSPRKTIKSLKQVIEKDFREAREEADKLDQAGFIALPGEVKPLEINDENIKKVLEKGTSLISIKDSIVGMVSAFWKNIKGFMVFEADLKKYGSEYNQLIDNIRTGLLPIFKKESLVATQIWDSILGIKPRRFLDKQAQKEENLIMAILALEDFIERGGRGLENPGGITVEQAQKELDNLLKQTNNKIKTAVNKTHELLISVGVDLVERGVLDEEALVYQKYFPHKVLDYQPDWADNVLSYLPRRLREPFRPYSKKAVGSVKDIITDRRALVQYTAVVFTDNAIDDWAVKQLKELDLFDKLSEEEKIGLFGVDKGGNLKRPKPNKIYTSDISKVLKKGETYVGFQYIPGRVLFRVNTINPELVNIAVEEGLTMEEFLEEFDMGSATALGRYHKTYLLPKVVADRFNKLKSPMNDIPGLYMARAFTMGWKKFTIDLAGLPYHLINIFSDAYMFFMTAPGAISEVLTSINLLKKNINKMTAEEKRYYEFLIEKNVWGSTFYSEFGKKIEFTLNPLEYIEKYGTIRENILRGAMAIYQLKRREAGLPFKAPQFKRDIEGLDDESAAAFIGRNFTVDYMAISEAYRKYLRGLAFPFLTFFDYITRNLAKLARFAPIRFITAVIAPILMAWIYNNTGDRKEIEENLPEYWRWRTHLILKRTTGNRALIWSLQTPADLAASWIGADRILDKITLIRAGRMTVEEAAMQQLKDMGLGTPRQLEKLSNPMIQLFQGYASNKDPFTGRTIIPEYLKDTSEEQKLLAFYFAEKLALPMAQYSRVEKGIEPEGNPITDWLRYGAFNYKRALGFYEVDLTTGQSSYFYDTKAELEGKRNQLLFKIEQGYIEGKSENIIEDYQKQAQLEGFTLTNEEINARINSIRVQIAKNKALLRAEDNKEKRKPLLESLEIFQKQRVEEILNVMPKNIREKFVKEVSPKKQ